MPEQEEHFIITFKDETLLEVEADRERVSALMTDGPIRLNIWVLPSEFGIFDGKKEAYGVLKFWKNGEAVLEEYGSEFIGDDVPLDLIFLNMYLEEKGWKFVIGNDLRDGSPAVWNRLIGIIFDVHEDFPEDIDYDDEEFDEEMSFVEYEKRLAQHRRPSFGSYRLIDFEEFKDHTFDFNKRKEEEEKRIF